MKWLTNIVAAYILEAVNLPEYCGTSPGCLDMSWSTATFIPSLLCDGDHSGFLSFPFTSHSLRWLLPNIHEGHIGGWKALLRNFGGK